MACIRPSEHWNYNVYGRSFTLRTYHSAITAQLGASNQGRRPLRLLRWAERFQQYDFQVGFRLANQNQVADLLCHQTPCVRQVRLRATRPMTFMFLGPSSGQVLIKQPQLKIWPTQQKGTRRSAWASTLSSMVCTRTNRNHPSFEQSTTCCNSSVLDGSIFRGVGTVVPSELRDRVIQLANEGHAGIGKANQPCRLLVGKRQTDAGTHYQL